MRLADRLASASPAHFATGGGQPAGRPVVLGLHAFVPPPPPLRLLSCPPLLPHGLLAPLLLCAFAWRSGVPCCFSATTPPLPSCPWGCVRGASSFAASVPLSTWPQASICLTLASICRILASICLTLFYLLLNLSKDALRPCTHPCAACRVARMQQGEEGATLFGLVDCQAIGPAAPTCLAPTMYHPPPTPQSPRSPSLRVCCLFHSPCPLLAPRTLHTPLLPLRPTCLALHTALAFSGGLQPAAPPPCITY